MWRSLIIEGILSGVLYGHVPGVSVFRFCRDELRYRIGILSMFVSLCSRKQRRILGMGNDLNVYSYIESINEVRCSSITGHKPYIAFVRSYIIYIIYIY